MPTEKMNQPSSSADHAAPHDGKRIRPSGGYRQLRSFQVATIIYDATVLFCERFLDKRSRTVDQMVQAARSGRQNIAEGSRAAATSSQTELRLMNVARASLDELLLDYEDYLRQRGKRQWQKNDSEALAVRAVGFKHDEKNPIDHSDPTAHWKLYSAWLNHEDSTIVANTVICLIHQANYLLDQQITALERQFITEGGYSEQLAAARLAERAEQCRANQEKTNEQAAPVCPTCGKLMVLRTARKGKHAGSQFWGCAGYPECKGTRPVSSSDGSDETDRSMQGEKSQ